MLHIPSGIIPFPRVQYATLQKPIKDAQWNLRDMRFLRNCPVSMRYFVILDRGLSNGTVTRYQAEFQNMIDEYKTGTYTLCGSAKVFPGKGGVVSGLQMAQGQNANFVLLILKEKDVEAYSIFKNQTDRYLGMHSLCITEKPNMKKSKLNNNLKPYFANVMMKSNLKAGGTNHSVEDVSNILKDTLVLGADVTHPSKGALYGTPSIAAVVGSVDELGGKFLGSMRLQAKRDLNPPPKSKNTADDDATGKNDTEVS